MARELKWGETVFHHATEAELRDFAIKAYAALISAKSALAILAYGRGDAADPFFADGGTGGDALAMCNAVLAPLAVHDGEMYRCYYRPALPFLFPNRHRAPRWICNQCGLWWESDSDAHEFMREANCPQTGRRMELADVHPIL